MDATSLSNLAKALGSPLTNAAINADPTQSSDPRIAGIEKALAHPAPASASSSGLFSWLSIGRVATLLVGLLLLGAGIFALVRKGDTSTPVPAPKTPKTPKLAQVE